MGRFGQLLGAAALAIVLAGCAETAPDTQFVECEPGVEGISQLGDITPAGCP